MNKLSQIISTLFYIGYFKLIPGTMGSLFSIAIIILLKHFLNNIFFVCIFVLLFFISLKLIEIYSKSINKHDSSEIVIDEFLGIYFIMIFLDYISFSNILIDITLAFIFFRIFDILKPFPINFIDKKFNNSFGVIFDDIIAGIYSLVTLFLINAFI